MAWALCGTRRPFAADLTSQRVRGGRGNGRGDPGFVFGSVWPAGDGGRFADHDLDGGHGRDWFLFDERERGGVYGWLDGGFVGNFGVPASKFNVPYNAVDRANEPMMNQVLIFEYRPSSRWDYLFHHWLGTQADGLAGGGKALWVGIDQYRYYRVNKSWAWGARFEWFQHTDGTRVGLNRPSNPNHVPLPGNFYSLTLGPNWTPTGNFLMRR